MPQLLISYDIEKVSNVHEYVKDQMLKIGYFDSFISSQNETKKLSLHTLPNTTLWHPNKTTDQARLDLKTVANKFRDNGEALIEKVFCTEILHFRSYNNKSRIPTQKEITDIPNID